MAVLAVDGPGQGSSLKLRNIKSRYDYEVPIGKAIDYLYTRKDVDKNKIVMCGASMGGYYAPRAAAFDKRIKALVVWGANFDMGASYRTLLTDPATAKSPTAAYFEKLGIYLLGAKNREEVVSMVTKFSLEGVIDKITCPTFIIHGEADVLTARDAPQRTYDGVKGPKKLVWIKKGEPGQTHCQGDSIVIAQYHILNWIEETFK